MLIARAKNCLFLIRHWYGLIASIPGIQIEFKIFHYLNGTEQVLWNKYLTPVCTYTAKDEEFASSELYKRMVNETINSFENNGKS